MTVNEGFLDTTILFERLSPEQQNKDKVEKALNEFDFLGTSTYAFLEFKGSFFQSLAYLYKHLKKQSKAQLTSVMIECVEKSEML